MSSIFKKVKIPSRRRNLVRVPQRIVSQEVNPGNFYNRGLNHREQQLGETLSNVVDLQSIRFNKPTEENNDRFNDGFQERLTKGGPLVEAMHRWKPNVEVDEVAMKFKFTPRMIEAISLAHKKFKTAEALDKPYFTAIRSFKAIHDVFSSIVREIIRFFHLEDRPNAIIQLSLSDDTMKDTEAIPCYIGDPDVIDKFIAALIKWFKSRDVVELLNSKKFKVLILRSILPGGICPEIKDEDIALEIHRDHAIIHITNTDNLCLVRCLTLGYYKYQEGYSHETSMIESYNNKEYELYMGIVIKMMKHDGKSIGELINVQRFEQSSGYRVIIINQDKTPEYWGREPRQNDKIIYLQYTGNHFNFINKAHKYFNPKWKWICHYCFRGTQSNSSKQNHFKEGACKFNPFPTQQDELCGGCTSPDNNHHEFWRNFHTFKKMQFRCEHCNQKCSSEECLEYHKQNDKRCKKVWQCLSCDIKISHEHKEQHICDKPQKKCKNCGEVDFLLTHQCFIKSSPPSEKNVRIINHFHYFDIEAYINNPIHQCSEIKITNMETGQMELFRRDSKEDQVSTIEKFCKRYFKKHADKTIDGILCTHKFYFFSHNGSNYDVQPIVNYAQSHGIAFKTIGSLSLKYVEFPELNIYFVDSLNFIRKPLHEFPEMFGLEQNKGFFPMKADSSENEFEIFTKPFPIEDYLPNNLSPKRYQELVKFVEEENQKYLQNPDNYRISLRDLRHEYNEKDVLIGAEGLKIFRDTFMELTGCERDPLTFITITQASAQTFIDHFMPENSIPLPNPYIESKRYELSTINLINGIPHYFAKDQRIYSCLYEGCIYCHAHGRNYLTGFNYETQLQKRKKDKVKKPIQFCHIEKDINEYYSKNITMEKWLTYFEYSLMRMRGAAGGGRTEAWRLFYICRPDEQILYYDCNGMYPHIMSTGRFPSSQSIYIDDLIKCQELFDSNQLEGVLKCSILPPDRLYVPVLNLKFDDEHYCLPVLCFTCAWDFCFTENKHTRCEHSDEERTLHGEWHIDEIKLAIEQGYKLIKIHSAIHHERTRTDIFTDYMEVLTAFKTQASGFPDEYIGREEEFIDEYLKKTGTLLNKEDIIKNPGLKEIAKSLTTSLWGYLSRDDDYGKTVYFSLQEMEKFDKDFTDPDVEVRNISICGKLMSYTRKTKDYYPRTSYNINPMIGIYTTAQARVNMYRKHILPLLQQNREADLMMMDTDSCIWINKDDQPFPKSSPFPGEFKNEAKKGLEIKMMVIEALKTYIHLSFDPTEYRELQNKAEVKYREIKSCGFGLNHGSEDKITFEKFEEMLKYAAESISSRISIIDEYLPEIDDDIKVQEMVKKIEEHEIKRSTEKPKIIIEESAPRPFVEDGIRGVKTVKTIKTLQFNRHKRLINYKSLLDCYHPELPTLPIGWKFTLQEKKRHLYKEYFWDTM